MTQPVANYLIVLTGLGVAMCPRFMYSIERLTEEGDANVHACVAMDLHMCLQTWCKLELIPNKL